MSLLTDNIKYLRKQKSFTQQQLADKIGIKRSLIGAYEEERAEPGLEYLQIMARLFEVSVDHLIGENLSDPENFKKLMQKDIEAKKLRVLSITVDKEDNENIVLVPHKAAAGYLNGYADTEYVAELPQFNLPGFKNGTFRAFEITGDSMLPIMPGSIIIGQYIENWSDLKDDKTYVLLTQDEGIVYKRVYNQVKNKGVLNLVSDNPAYSSYEVPVDNLLEAWEAKAYVSSHFPMPEMSMHKLSSLVSDLQNEVKRLKK